VEKVDEGWSGHAGDDGGPFSRWDGDDMPPHGVDDGTHVTAKGQGDGAAHDAVGDHTVTTVADHPHEV
jgi:hypothetical protein